PTRSARCSGASWSGSASWPSGPWRGAAWRRRRDKKYRTTIRCLGWGRAGGAAAPVVRAKDQGGGADGGGRGGNGPRNRGWSPRESNGRVLMAWTVPPAVAAPFLKAREGAGEKRPLTDR